MRILVSGSGGLVGRAVSAYLASHQHAVVALHRPQSTNSPGHPDSILWDPVGNELDPATLENFDAILHLAGENIGGKRWTDGQKARIKSSRVHPTQLLSDAITLLKHPPRVLLCASAVGYYGNRGDETLTEESSPGHDFLAEVCREWEAAALPASKHGVRVVNLRMGAVLAKEGGLLPRLLPLFLLGLGGTLGSGRQFMAWIAINDLMRIVELLLQRDDIHGPVNVVAPTPITNVEFTKILGKMISRPTLLPVPALALRIMLGELAEGLLLTSTRVTPARLQAAGYSFMYPRLEDALAVLIRK
jgi:uncharacterized protein (TIGR01777 family)